MATSDVSNKSGGFIENFNKPPWIGISTFVVVILMQGLGHTVMILMELLLGHDYVYQSAAAMGLFGAWLWYIGLTNPSAIKTDLDWLFCRDIGVDRMGRIFICVLCRLPLSARPLQ